LRPRAGRFWTTKVAKQTKKNSIKNATFLWNFLLFVLWLQKSCNDLNVSCHYFLFYILFRISIVDDMN
jgi:hypothetical protein